MGNCLFSPVKPMVGNCTSTGLSTSIRTSKDDGGSDKKVCTKVDITSTQSSTADGVPNKEARRSDRSTADIKKSREDDNVASIKGVVRPQELRVYSLTELKRATSNFNPQALVGEGEFGKVFKGWFDEKTLKPSVRGCGVAVAVKRYQLQKLQSLQEWQSEVKYLGSLAHPNIVKLFGYCQHDRQLLLVSEFMTLGNLESHLFGRGAALEPLTWCQRLKIAIGAARGLAFLHTSEKQVIYRDIKASNILLDSGYNAKLSGFGLARNGPTDGTHVTTQLKGSFVYAAPEYIATGRLCTQSDVYGFGIVLLEMLSGRRASDRQSGDSCLVEWARPFLADSKMIARLMDPRLDGQYPSKEAFRLGLLILQCLAHDRKSRPSMRRVMQTLAQIEAVSTGRALASIPIHIVHGAIPHCLPLPPSKK